MKKCILIFVLLGITGCSSEVAKWENAGTLVSVRPAEENARPPGRMGTTLGEEEIGLTRVETTEGVYVVHGKISFAQTGMPVKLGYEKKDSSDELQDTPSYLSFGGQEHRIAH
jgi:hypothetical protein